MRESQEPMRSLYISHIGMTEPLGQSQVLPYLTGLARRGAEIRIVAFESAKAKPDAIAALRERLAADKIDYRPLVRSPAHDLGTKVFESSRAVLVGLASALLKRPHIVHARSYLPAAVADVVASLAPRARLLFDCRGMLGDEYVDNGQWTTDRLEYRLLKRFEQRVFRKASGVVVLTRALRRWLDEQRALGPRTNVEVIPCCVDLGRFAPDEASRIAAREELGVGDRFVLLYSGSLGSWYLETEMAAFAAEMRAALAKRAVVGDGSAPPANGAPPKLAVVVLSHSDATPFTSKLRAQGFTDDDLIVKNVPPAKMPYYLRAGDVGMSFIQSCFSKKGSSPTKVAEYLASGLVVALNGDIGDQADLGREEKACVVLPSYRQAALAEAASKAVALASVPYQERAGTTWRVARDHFGLEEVGVPRYERLYRAVAS